MNPNARTVKALKDDGWTVTVTEWYDHRTRRKHDLWGFVDTLAVRGKITLAVQTTTRSNMSARRKKIRQSKYLQPLLDAGWLIEIWGWDKKDGKNRVKVEVVHAE